MKRRKFSQLISSSAVIGSVGMLNELSEFFPAQISRSGYFDAMGELRPVYGRPLIDEMIQSGLNAITVTLCDPKTYEEEARMIANEGVEEYDRFIASRSDQLIKAESVADIDEAKASNRLAVFYLFQNSTPIGRDLTLVDEYYEKGLRSIQLTYNHQNWVGAGCKELNGSGLTDFGQQLVSIMNEKGLLIDLSHANMKTMADAIKASDYPVIISHTACMDLYQNIRNTTDQNLRLLSDHGGVVGICQIRPFVSGIKDGAFQHYLDHIVYAIKICGIDHVGIGSDRDHRRVSLTPDYLEELRSELGPLFDEDDFPLFMDELNGPGRMEVIWSGLKSRGLSEGEIDKVLGLNVRRIYGEIID